MFPEPGGDCQLLSDEITSKVSGWRMKLTRLPMAIACKILAAQNISGTAISIGLPYSNLALMSRNAPIDGSNGDEYIARHRPHPYSKLMIRPTSSAWTVSRGTTVFQTEHMMRKGILLAATGRVSGMTLPLSRSVMSHIHFCRLHNTLQLKSATFNKTSKGPTTWKFKYHDIVWSQVETPAHSAYC